MTDSFVIGIDLGATTVRAGAFTLSGELIRVQQTAIRAEEGPDSGITRILDLADSLILEMKREGVSWQHLKGIGVGSTGPTDPIKGTLVNPLTMPGWLDVPIVEPLQSKFDVPVCLENDADAAALGEFWQGAGKIKPDEKNGVSSQIHRLYAITVGTGIGTAFICDGQIYRGAGGFHPEGGHQIIDPSGPLCYCGANGCWESISSGSAIGRAAREVIQQQGGEKAQILRLAGGSIEKIDARMVAEAAMDGDELALEIIQTAARGFARGVINIIMLFYPDTIVLSGGVMHSLALFLPILKEYMNAASGYVPTQGVKILPAKLGYFAGIYGAAYAILISSKYQ